MNYNVCTPRTKVPFVFERIVDEMSERGFRTGPMTNILESDKGFRIDMTLPGATKEAVKIEVVEDKLHVRFDRPAQEEVAEGWRYTHKEFSLRSIERRFKLPQQVDKRSITARFAEGILHIEMSKLNKAETEDRQGIPVEWH